MASGTCTVYNICDYVVSELERANEGEASLPVRVRRQTPQGSNCQFNRRASAVRPEL